MLYEVITMPMLRIKRVYDPPLGGQHDEHVRMGELVFHLPVPESDGAGEGADTLFIAQQERPPRRRVRNNFV